MMFREEKKSFFGKMSQRIGDALAGKATIDDDFMDELEEILITSDIGMETTMKIVDMLRTEVKTNNLTKPSVIKIRLAKIISSVINKKEEQKLCQDTPLVILMIGINGGGKTTSIGKLAHKLRQEGKTVMLAAADTFRAMSSSTRKGRIRRLLSTTRSSLQRRSTSTCSSAIRPEDCRTRKISWMS